MCVIGPWTGGGLYLVRNRRNRTNYSASPGQGLCHKRRPTLFGQRQPPDSATKGDPLCVVSINPRLLPQKATHLVSINSQLLPQKAI